MLTGHLNRKRQNTLQRLRRLKDSINNNLASVNKEDKAALDQIEDSYELNLNNADKDYEEVCDSLEQKKDEYNDRIEDLTDRIA